MATKIMTQEELQKKAIAQYLKNQEYSKRATAKQTIMLKKAKDAGITVSDAEIDAYLVEHAK